VRNFQSTNKRLLAIEGYRGADAIRLTFEDGSTRGVRVRKDFALDLFEDLLSKMRAYPPPAPEGSPITPPPAEPQTRSDELIDLLGAAVSIEAEQEIIFLNTMHEMARQLFERKKEKRKALTLHQGN